LKLNKHGRDQHKLQLVYMLHYFLHPTLAILPESWGENTLEQPTGNLRAGSNRTLVPENAYPPPPTPTLMVRHLM
jgi:hypothetical protein